MTEPELAALVRSIVDTNRFMALGTADRDGTPWVSPVWYAAASYREYLWVSRPGTRHSRNLTDRPQVAITIYDSHGPGEWAALYMAGTAAAIEDVDAPLAVFNRRGRKQRLRGWSRTEVVAPGEFRLYRAAISEQFVLDDHDGRRAVRVE
jgi:nitroimidazol reductase NimA-like FMN-containing flavoprotein (pyridoxamine 5'-phosphate oxidase superfamily)